MPCNEIPANYYVEGGLRYLCFYCGPSHHSYFGNLADLFQGVGLYSLVMIFLVYRRLARGGANTVLNRRERR